jgi:hypothetical protein
METLSDDSLETIFSHCNRSFQQYFFSHISTLPHVKLTDANMTLLSLSNIFDPCAVAPVEPINKLPIEQIERSRREF